MYVWGGMYLRRYIPTESRRGHSFPRRVLQGDGPPDGVLRIELRFPGREADAFLTPRHLSRPPIILKTEEKGKILSVITVCLSRLKSHSWEVAQKMAL